MQKKKKNINSFRVRRGVTFKNSNVSRPIHRRGDSIGRLGKTRRDMPPICTEKTLLLSACWCNGRHGGGSGSSDSGAADTDDSDCGGNDPLHATAINGRPAADRLQGFFRRSIQQKIQYRPCTKNQQCNILRINRNRCQYCRLRKCISVGMSRDGECYEICINSPFLPLFLRRQ